MYILINEGDNLRNGASLIKYILKFYYQIEFHIKYRIPTSREKIPLLILKQIWYEISTKTSEEQNGETYKSHSVS